MLTSAVQALEILHDGTSR